MPTYLPLVGPALFLAGLLVFWAFSIQRRNTADHAAVRDNLAVSLARSDRGRHAGTRTGYHFRTQPGTDSNSHGYGNGSRSLGTVGSATQC